MPNASTVETAWSDLSDKEQREIVRRFLKGATIETLSAETRIKPGTLQRRINELLRFDEYGAKAAVGNFEKFWPLFCKMIGRDASRPIVSGKRRKIGKRRRIGVLCDIHSNPHPDVIGQIEASEPDIIVIDGDLFDLYAFSRFPKMSPIPLMEEVARVRALLERLNGLGPSIEVVTGNHDERARRWFAERIPLEFMALVQWNLLELVSQKLLNVKLISNEFRARTGKGTPAGVLTNNYMHALGDAIVGHFNISRQADGASANAAYSWITLWRRTLGLTEPRLLVQAHVHRASISYPQGGHLILVEGGFSGMIGGAEGRSGPMQWQHEMGNTKGSPPVLGFTLFEQDLEGESWRTDPGSVRFVPC